VFGKKKGDDAAAKATVKAATIARRGVIVAAVLSLLGVGVTAGASIYTNAHNDHSKPAVTTPAPESCTMIKLDGFDKLLSEHRIDQAKHDQLKDEALQDELDDTVSGCT
jgi:hypothetical protein